MAKCQHCLTKFKPARFLQKNCELTEDCRDHAIRTVLEKNRKLQEKKEKDKWSEEKKVILDKLKTLSDYKKDLEFEINAIVRLIDKGHDCTSGGFKGGAYKVHAGHLYSVGAFPSIRFNLLNIYCQSEHDNLHLHGNGAIYKERIAEIFGKEIAEEVEQIKVKYSELKASIPEVKEAIQISKQIKKALTTQNEIFSTEERISLRRTYNKMIGLYN